MNLKWRDYVTNKLLPQPILPSSARLFIVELIRIFKDLAYTPFTTHTRVVRRDMFRPFSGEIGRINKYIEFDFS